jgi:hypothetical protein
MRAGFDDIITAYRQWLAKFMENPDNLKRSHKLRTLEEISTITVPKGPNALW